MKRNLLLNMLHAYEPTHAENSFKIDMISFIKNYENCFERSLEIGHITASCWLLNKNHSHALLTQHAKLNAWYQLGGHCDGDFDVLNVALKEAREESGIQSIEPIIRTIFDIDIHLIPESKKEKAHYHYDVRFLLHVTSDEQVIKSNESKDLRWINKDKKNLPAESLGVIRLFDKWITTEL